MTTLTVLYKRLGRKPVAHHLVNALFATGVDEETIGEVVDRLEPLSMEIVNNPPKA